MRQVLLLCSLFLFAMPLAAQSVTYQTITDNASGAGASAVGTGNFDSDGGNDVVSIDPDGNINCIPSDGGKYDLPAVITPVQFPFPANSFTNVQLKPGATDSLVVTGYGIVNVYTSSGCTFTFSQSLIAAGQTYTPAITPAPSGGVFLSFPAVVVDGNDITYPAEIFQNNNGTFVPGAAGFGPAAAVFRAGNAIGVANPEPPPVPPTVPTLVSLWTYVDGAWSTTTPALTTGPLVLGFVTATNTKAMYVVSRDNGSTYIQLVNPDGSFGAPVVFSTGIDFDVPEAMVVFGGDSLAFSMTNSTVVILQDSTGNGQWAQLGDPITVTIPGGGFRTFIGGAPTTTGFVFQSQDGTATVFTVGNGPMIVVPSSLSFTATAEGSSSSQTLSLTNSGNTALTVSGATFSGPNGGDFTQTNTCTGIAPAGTCTMTVSYAPTTPNLETATMVINSNAVNSPSVSIYAPPAPAPIVTTSGTSLDYGNVAVNSNATLTLVIGNSGSAPLTNISVTESGAGYSITTPCATSLAALAQCSVVVKFAPTTTGPLTGSLTITSNAPAVTIALSGTGTPAPAVAAVPPALAASSGGTVTAQITFQNFPSTPTLTAACQIPAGSCTIQGNSQLVVTTTARTSTTAKRTAAIFPGGFGAWRWPGALLLIGAAGLCVPRRRRMTVVAFAGMVLLAACNGGSSAPPPMNGTPAGTYNVVVTGVAGAVTQSVTVPVTVN